MQIYVDLFFNEINNLQTNKRKKNLNQLQKKKKKPLRDTFFFSKTNNLPRAYRQLCFIKTLRFCTINLVLFFASFKEMISFWMVFSRIIPLPKKYNVEHCWQTLVFKKLQGRKPENELKLGRWGRKSTQ